MGCIQHTSMSITALATGHLCVLPVPKLHPCWSLGAMLSAQAFHQCLPNNDNLLEAVLYYALFWATGLAFPTRLTAAGTRVFIAPGLWSAYLTPCCEWSLFHCAGLSYSTFSEEMVIIHLTTVILVGGFFLSKPFICLKDENIWPSAGLVCDNDHVPQFLVAGLFLNKLY